MPHVSAGTAAGAGKRQVQTPQCQGQRAAGSAPSSALSALNSEAPPSVLVAARGEKKEERTACPRPETRGIVTEEARGRDPTAPGRDCDHGAGSESEARPTHRDFEGVRACECEWSRAVKCASENALRRAPRAVQRPSLVPTLLRAVSVASLRACPAAAAAAVCRWTQPSAREQRDSVPHLTPLKSHAARHSGVVRGCTCWCVREYVPALVLMQ